MIFLSLKGTIVHIYKIKNLYSTYNEFEYFPKQFIVLENESEMYTICFIDKKIELLKNCEVGSEVELEIKLKGRMWKHNGIVNSTNELSCLNLKLITKKKPYVISCYNSHYTLSKFYNNNTVHLKLINLYNHTEMPLSAVFDFEEHDKHDHVLIPNFLDNNIISILEQDNVLEHLYDVHQNGGASGHLCKILVIEKFGKDGLLYK